MLTLSQGPTIASEFVVPALLSIPIVFTPAAPAAPVSAITAEAASNVDFKILVVMWSNHSVEQILLRSRRTSSAGVVDDRTIFPKIKKLVNCIRRYEKMRTISRILN